MERFINFRAFLFIFIGAIIGVVFSLQLFLSNLSVFILSCILILGLLIFVIITSFFDKSKKFSFINKFFICFLIGFIFFSSTSCFNFTNFSKNLENIDKAKIQARICNISSSSGYEYLILEDCIITDLKSEKNYRPSGKISVVVYTTDILEDLSIGDRVSFNGQLNKNSLLENAKFNSYYYKYDIKYSSFINIEDFSYTNGSLKFDEKVRAGVKEILFDNLSYDNAAICYATIFGDKTLLDKDIYDSFSLSGTAHILCVSGLHVGFLVTLLYLFFKLFKLKRKHILIILIVLLTFYCYLCGFSPSVVRASLMSIILCFAQTFGERYDSLSSLSLAGILILLFKPFYVFDVGFQLSFASCFGIILLTPTFTSFFRKIDFDNKFSQAFSLTLSAQIATFPIILHNFEKMSFLSICANLIVVPLFSVIFSLLVVFVLINAILPFGFLFKIIELCLNFIIFITKSFGAVSSMIMSTSTFPLLYSLLFYLIVIGISKFINLKYKARLITILSLIVVFCFSYLFQFYPTTFNQNLILNGSINNCSIITNSNNKKIMINVGQGTSEDLALIKQDLLSFKILKLDALILSNYNESIQNTVVEICNKYFVDTLYLPNNLSFNEEKFLFKNLKTTFIFKTEEKYYNFDNFNFKILSEINGVYLNALEDEHSFTMLVANNLDSATSAYIIKENLSGDFVKFKYINKNYLESVNKFDIILCKNSSVRQSNVYSLNKMPVKINLKLFEEKIYEI